MTALRILLSRWRVHRASRLLAKGKAILDAEELRWGLRGPLPSGRPPAAGKSASLRS